MGYDHNMNDKMPVEPEELSLTISFLMWAAISGFFALVELLSMVAVVVLGIDTFIRHHHHPLLLGTCFVWVGSAVLGRVALKNARQTKKQLDITYPR